MTFVAQGFPVRYGSSITAAAVERFASYVVVTQPEPWALLEPAMPHPPRQVVLAGDLSPAHLEHLVADVAPTEAVIAIGGGSAMDTGKWLHWRRGVPLVSVPSLPSVNACFTRMTALRDDGGVRYEGDAVPEEVIVDFDLIHSAPAHLIRGGIGDVLSCHTALFDWEYATARRHDPPWDAAAAQMSLVYLDELEALAPGLRETSDDSIRRLMELHRDIGWRCHELGHARFEEGSEHFFAYTFEEVTGRTIMHGELVAFGVAIMSALQGNDPTRARRIIDASGMRSTPDQLGITLDELHATLRRLASFVAERGLWYSVANDLVVNDDQLETARRAVGASG